MKTPHAPLYWAALLAACVLRASAAIDNGDCFTCHDDKTLVKTNKAGRIISLNVTPATYAASTHGSNACTSCHADITEVPHPANFSAKEPACAACHAVASASYSNSVHGIGVRTGRSSCARCADCHGTHDIVPVTRPDSPLSHSRVAGTCGTCHPQVVKDLTESIHGQAMAKGITDAPTCTDCHADHQIEDLRTASPIKIAEDVCSRCHASARLNTRYRLPSNRASSFFDSYHGLAARLGSMQAANCASCHGYHSIFPSSDPRSSVNPANMSRTCRKCHPGANENFSQGRIHVDATSAPDIGNTISGYVRAIYLLLIFGVIAGMLVHNFLVFRKKFMIAHRNDDKSIIRMTLVQRVQHGLLMVSFTALAVTGFALKYPDGWIAYLVGSNEQVRRVGHRVAAVVMLATALAHLVYLFSTREGRKMLRDIMPGWCDVKGALANLRYLLIPGSSKPDFARFSYGEKLEYWAVVWGTIIMGLTGVMITYKMEMTQWLPRWAIEVATTVHYYEAILAVLAIIVWHFYAVIFDPDVYPNNTAWLTGRVSRHWYQEEHGLDTETLKTSAPHGEPRPPQDHSIKDKPHHE